MQSLALFALVGAAMLAVANAQAADQNSWSFMERRSTACSGRYNTLIESRFYATDDKCKTLVKNAVTIYNKADCPSTVSGSEVWTCMTGYKNGTVNMVGRRRGSGGRVPCACVPDT